MLALLTLMWRDPLSLVCFFRQRWLVCKSMRKPLILMRNPFLRLNSFSLHSQACACRGTTYLVRLLYHMCVEVPSLDLIRASLPSP